ncbi:hypothetical protein [Myroides marinus]|uniref:Peptidase S74 domain-containing protein n=1 Tax=Myroides marinus TaxID=703342 RepID=A0A1H6TMM5_9FLAO|nr:hypothetical protein [Myroides marinus]MDM1378759.1 hypothetical protein [Myroides marinus]MDM1386030.1 hypothetical protein [Myroides marinus]MDM1393192.1 hypothetical protein [Myroides marinus]SEI77002.1 hypothetical protein SAMN04488018_104123 [Myroides marinus]
MKSILIPVSLLLSGYLAYAQVGIGTKALHISAVLDLKADDRGLLVPQVQLKSLSDGSIVKGGGPHLGLLVFNTTSNATLRPGFYYWGSDNSGDVRGNRWIAIGDDVNASMGNKPKLSLKVENSSLVLGDKDGNIAAVPLVDLQVPTSIVADPINKGSYIYTNESRQTFRIDVVQDVITNFGDIIKNKEVVKEIVKVLKGKYGNVLYESNKFYTINPDTGVKEEIIWSDLDTTNKSFTIQKEGDIDYLVITDSKNNKVHMPVAELATNKTFVKELTENKEFIEKITNNKEFIKNIINKLKGKYGNVIYEGGKFYTVDPDTGNKTEIVWSDLDTTNAKYGIEAINGVESIVITDSKNNKVHMPVAELATNKTFVKELTENKEFIEKITNNNEFVKNIINKLKGKYGNVYYDGKDFYTLDPDTGAKTLISWSDLDTTNAKYGIEAINGVESIVITDSKNNKVHMPVAELATNKTFVKELTENKEFIEKITNNNEFVKNIINKLKSKYGNVIYEGGKFYTVDPDTGNKTEIVWSDLDTTNKKFTLETEAGVDYLVITDSKLGTVKIDVKEIAASKTFIDEITNNPNFITNIKKVQAYGSIVNQTNAENTSDVKLAKKFNSGKENEAAVLLSETLTSLAKVKENGTSDTDNFIAYNYLDETGKPAQTQITVTSDVVDSFEQIIKEPKVINELNKFITNATGNVTVSKDPVTNNITISYKDNGNTEELHLTTEVKRVQNYGSLTSVAADKVAKTGKGLTFNNGKEAAGSFNESLTGFTTKTDKVTLEDGTQGDAVTYVYKDESTNDQLLPITADIAKTFKTIANQEGNKEYIENIVNNAVPSGFTFNNGKEVKGSYVETVTSLERKETQTNLPDNKTGKSIKYEYKDETGKVIDITVTDDVASSFTTIINQGDNKTAIENIIKNLIKSEGSKVTVERNATSGDVTLVIVNDQNTERVNISAMIKDNAKNPWLVQGSANVTTTDTENIAHTGTVAIGGNTLLSNPKATNTKLSVTGDVVIDGKFFSANSVYADYVFEKYFTGASNLNLTYEFKSLDYVKDFVEKYNHLPGVTKISDVSRSEDGKYMIDFTELSIQQLEKIEELYLHTIEQEGKIESLNKKVDEMEARLKALEQLLNK